MHKISLNNFSFTYIILFVFLSINYYTNYLYHWDRIKILMRLTGTLLSELFPIWPEGTGVPRFQKSHVIHLFYHIWRQILTLRVRSSRFETSRYVIKLNFFVLLLVYGSIKLNPIFFLINPQMRNFNLVGGPEGHF